MPQRELHVGERLQAAPADDLGRLLESHLLELRRDPPALAADASSVCGCLDSGDHCRN